MVLLVFKQNNLSIVWYTLIYESEYITWFIKINYRKLPIRGFVCLLFLFLITHIMKWSSQFTREAFTISQFFSVILCLGLFFKICLCFKKSKCQSEFSHKKDTRKDLENFLVYYIFWTTKLFSTSISNKR